MGELAPFWRVACLRRRLASTSLVVAVAIAVSGCMEVASTGYADRNEAIARDAIGKSKWLPEWLPEDAVNIREAHDMDTNESWLVFHSTSRTLALPEDCRQAGRPEMSKARVMWRFPPVCPRRLVAGISPRWAVPPVSGKQCRSLGYAR